VGREEGGGEEGGEGGGEGGGGRGMGGRGGGGERREGRGGERRGGGVCVPENLIHCASAQKLIIFQQGTTSTFSLHHPLFTNFLPPSLRTPFLLSTP
jgi:hypothetical protein